MKAHEIPIILFDEFGDKSNETVLPASKNTVAGRRVALVKKEIVGDQKPLFVTLDSIQDKRYFRRSRFKLWSRLNDVLNDYSSQLVIFGGPVSTMWQGDRVFFREAVYCEARSISLDPESLPMLTILRRSCELGGQYEKLEYWKGRKELSNLVQVVQVCP